MPVQINLEDFAKPWKPGVYPKSTTVIYNNQLWILNDTITGLFTSSDFETEVANGDWIGRYTTQDEFAEVAYTGNYNDLINLPNIPTKTSQLENDGEDGVNRFITAQDLPTIPTNTSYFNNDGSDGTSTYVETDELGQVAFSNDYNDLDNKPVIPTVITNHSELTLDDGTNPHGTTKTDVGLGNVPNLDTTDAVNNSHTHTNKSILDLITEPFTTSLKSLYDGAVTSINNLLLTGQRLITSSEITKLNNTSGTNTGDETTLSIQTKRPLKTINGESLEGVGNLDISGTGGVSTAKACRFELTNNIDLGVSPTGSVTVIDFDNSVFNTNSSVFVNNGSGTVTCTQAGSYLVTTSIVLESPLASAITKSELGIRKNGTTIICATTDDTPIAVGQNVRSLTTSTIINLNANDTLQTVVNLFGTTANGRGLRLPALLGTTATQVSNISIEKLEVGGLESIGYIPANDAEISLVGKSNNYNDLDNKPVIPTFSQISGISILSSGWSLVGSIYEYIYSNVNITSSSIVDVIPDNSAFSIVSTAQLLPRVDSSNGSLKLYSNNLPSGDFTITIIINK